MTDKTVEQRLEAQARAIRDLRRRVADLEAGIRTSDTEPLPDTPDPDEPFQHRSTCLDCGKPKEADRFTKSLCLSCARRCWNAQQAGTPVRYSKCGVCGKKLNGTIRPMCGKCENKRRRLMANT